MEKSQTVKVIMKNPLSQNSIEVTGIVYLTQDPITAYVSSIVSIRKPSLSIPSGRMLLNVEGFPPTVFPKIQSELIKEYKRLTNSDNA